MEPPGEHITADWELFCSFFVNLFWVKNIIISLSKKLDNRKKRGFCGRLTGHNFGRPLDRKQTFFYKGGQMERRNVEVKRK